MAIDTLALDVAQVRGGRARPSPCQIDEVCLDRHTPRIRSQPLASETGCGMPSPQAGTRLRTRFRHDPARLPTGLTSMAGLAQHLVDERVAALPGRARANSETVVVATTHRAAPSKGSAAGRAKHQVSPMLVRPCAPSRHAAPFGVCRATPTCRLALRGPKCRDLLSCPPSLPIAGATGPDGRASDRLHGRSAMTAGGAAQRAHAACTWIGSADARRTALIARPMPTSAARGRARPPRRRDRNNGCRTTPDSSR
ncbi:hypothetical protein SAMN05444746_102296 [Variovorax sp. OK212]|nr:hypothetical protein SAMN05518853_102296 [Variovorax sp. OK202]SFC51324.1 hypothetical protein SAMN05444746_102296 [Variovorax sp. OK212]